jgi:protein-disulfide isomerase
MEQAVRLFVSCLILTTVSAGGAQVAATAGTATASSPSLNRRIEVLIRSQFSVPPEYDMTLGEKTKSDTTDYDNLPVTFTHEDKKITVTFLISKDGSTLERVQKLDLNTNPALSIDVDKRPVRGSAVAKVEIINFDDLQCPYCGLLNSEILPQTLNHYQGYIKIVYKDYPLKMHPWAMRAAVDANCLASLNGSAYWAYVDYVHSHGQDIGGAQPDAAKSFAALDNIAQTMGTQNKVNQTELAMCLSKQDESLVNQSLKLGNSLGVSGTPQVFVDGERLPSGAPRVSELWPAIDRALKAQGIQPPPQKAPEAAPSSK